MQDVNCNTTESRLELGTSYKFESLWLFSHDGKVRILNRDSRCASWITIRNTVFWTVCTPNHVEIRDLRCTSQITVQGCFWVTHLKSRISTWFGVHTVQNTVFRIVIQDAHLESRFKIHTLPCESSLCRIHCMDGKPTLQQIHKHNASFPPDYKCTQITQFIMFRPVEKGHFQDCFPMHKTNMQIWKSYNLIQTYIRAYIPMHMYKCTLRNTSVDEMYFVKHIYYYSALSYPLLNDLTEYLKFKHSLASTINLLIIKCL